MTKIKITEFGDKDCPPCRQQRPIIKNLRKKHPDWNIKEVDIEKDSEFADKHNVVEIPTFIVEKGNKKKRWAGGPVGVREMEQIVEGM